MRFSAIPIILFLFFIIIPFKINFESKIIENIEDYIEGRRKKEINTLKEYLLIILFSPFILRNRFQKLNKICIQFL